MALWLSAKRHTRHNGLIKMTRSTISIQHNDITIMVLSILKLGTMTIQHDDITTMVLSILTLRILTFSITLNFMKARLQYGDLHSRLVCFKAQKLSPILKKTRIERFPPLCKYYSTLITIEWCSAMYWNNISSDIRRRNLIRRQAQNIFFCK
jgi:hypothetical protein